MPNPYGNPGNKGGGRKPLHVELKDKHWHAEKWEIDTLLETLRRKIKTKKYSVRDMFLLKALEGNERIITKFADKLLPDLTDMTSKGNAVNCVVALPDLKDGDSTE